MKPVLVSCASLVAILISVLVPARSSRISVIKHPNELLVARPSGVPLSLSRIRQRALFGRAEAASPISGLNFAPVVTYDAGSCCSGSVAVADVNGDGKPDLVVANGGNIGVYLSRGDGTFESVTLYGAEAISVAVADVNGDGKLDLVVASTTVGVLLGNGDGTFQTATNIGTGGSWIAVADVNGDGKPDLLVAQTCGSCGSLAGSAVVLLNKGDGTFQNAVSYASGGSSTEWIAAADVNGDGKPDLLVVNYTPNQTCTAGDTNCNGTVGVLLGDGDGTFKTAVTYGSGGYGATSVAVADVNGDGNPDLIVTNSCPGGNCATVGVLLGKGDGTFKTAVTYDSGGFEAQSVAVADVDGDGKPDLVVSNLCPIFPNFQNCNDFNTIYNGVVTVLLGNGDGTFQTAVAYGSGGTNDGGGDYANRGRGVVADVNNDGRPDVVVANECDSETLYNCYKQVGNGTVGVLINTSISFGLVASPSVLTIAASGGSASTTITINANGSLNAQSLTNWSCSGLPAESTCTFGTVSSNSQISMNITATAASDLHRPVMGHHQRLFYALLLPWLLGVVSIAGRKRTMCAARMTVLIIAVVLPATWVACGGGNSAQKGRNGGTPAGSSVVTISASDGTLKPSTTVELIVK